VAFHQLGIGSAGKRRREHQDRQSATQRGGRMP
jgi:hypothetical protein